MTKASESADALFKEHIEWTTALGNEKSCLLDTINKECEQLRDFVLKTTNRASSHRETLQVKYDEKLDKIKDICATYFSKYEK